MRKIHYRLLILAGLILTLVVVGPSSGAGKLFAFQQGSTTPGNVTGSGQSNPSPDTGTNPSITNNPANTPNNPQNGNYVGSGSNTGQQTAGQTPAGPGTYGATAPQTATDVSRATVPWGWAIGSFLVGLLVGGLAFSRTVYRDRIDRTDINRAA